MLPHLFAFLNLFQLSRATSTNECPSCEATSCGYRSVWSLLASCGLTLLICVWHAIHPAVPLPHFKRIDFILYRLSLMLLAFFAPEYMIGLAFDEWLEAKEITKRARDLGFTWWTMTHSHFVSMGGFALCDDTGVREIEMNAFLSLVQKGDIINPVVTEEDIKDKSTSDGLAKAILVVQLSWFSIQIVVRLVNHLAVTLVELDTVCMALLTVPLIVCWWTKPRCPGRPHIFYTRGFVKKNVPDQETGGESENLLDNSAICRTTTYREWDDLFTPTKRYPSSFRLLLFTWLIFGALHAIAWNYEFPSEIEKIMWRVASLTLAGTAAISVVLETVEASFDTMYWLSSFQSMMLLVGVISRLLLIGLVLASLRSLPSSAYKVIPWTSYIPHL